MSDQPIVARVRVRAYLCPHCRAPIIRRSEAFWSESDQGWRQDESDSYHCTSSDDGYEFDKLIVEEARDE
jgi:hypothetical protein